MTGARGSIGHAPFLIGAALILFGCRPGEPGSGSDAGGDHPSPPAGSSPSVEQARALPTPLFLEAALEGDLGKVRSALKGGTEVDVAGEEGRTALMLAAFNGHLEVVRLLLENGATVSTRDAIGRTALMYAATGPHAEVVQLLLNEGAEVNAVDHHEQWSALMFAAAEGHSDVVRLLLSKAANARHTDLDGETAAMFARQRGHIDLARLLEEAEADQAPSTSP